MNFMVKSLENLVPGMLLFDLARYKFKKSIPGAMKTMIFIFASLKNYARDGKYNDFGSIWMVFGFGKNAFCIGFDMLFIKNMVC